MDHLSSSQITLYLQCSLKYRFQYIDRLPKPFRSSGLAFGSAVHSALAWLHREKMKGSEAGVEKLYKIFDADWFSQRVESEIRYKDGEEEMKLLVMGREILGLYLQQPAFKIRGSEVPFTIPFRMNGERLSVNLEGIFDLIEEDDMIVEFKTSGQIMNQKDADDHLQLTAYAYAYEQLYHRSPKLLRIVDFVKNRKPRIVVLETKRKQADYQRFFYLAREVLKGISTKVFFPRTGFWCKDCEYEWPCRAWEGE
jgi:putative RecB family exonuclease